MSNSTHHIWSITFGQTEAVLSSMAAIERSKQSSFQFRLKNLFKVGFLPHVATGRGKVGRYNAGDLFLLAFAVELMQFDLGPHRILEAMDRLKAGIRSAALEGGHYIADGLAPLSLDNNLYLSFDPGGLASLTRDFGDKPKPTEHMFRGALQPEDVISRRLAIINISRLAADLALSVADVGLCPPEEFGGHLIDWARSEGAEVEDD
ncbi:hypothetical protein [Sphingobium yanoikuyae]|uniref:hypothetical protein n=2 Tax=Sphingobium yanoikuyae TaxID=13690 RepID=UPI00241ECBEA|nr:hypothetical protein [Sphingobium yanoikuyae]